MVMLPIPKNTKSIVLAVLLIKCALMIDLANTSFLTEEKMKFINSLWRFLMSMKIVEKR